MRRNAFKGIALTFMALVLALGAARHAQARDTKNLYPTSMVPLDQYLMGRDTEIISANGSENIENIATSEMQGGEYSGRMRGRDRILREKQRSTWELHCAVLKSQRPTRSQVRNRNRNAKHFSA